MKIQLDWPIDSVAETYELLREFDFIATLIDVFSNTIIIEDTQDKLRNFVFGKYTALLQSNPDWANAYGIPAHDDFCDLVVKN